jgi:predicted DNA-binding protein
MKVSIYSIRLDKDVSRALARISSDTVRTRAEVIRWLIVEKAKELESKPSDRAKLEAGARA